MASIRHRLSPSNKDDQTTRVGGVSFQDVKHRSRKSFEITFDKKMLLLCVGIALVVYTFTWMPILRSLNKDSVDPVPFDLRVGNSRLEAAYDLARREVYENIVHAADVRDRSGGEKSHFVAGAGWAQLWTRDSSYAIEQAGGLLAPEASINSLVKCTSKIPLDNGKALATVWYQDECGHFRGWPYLSDAIVGARGAWYVFLYTGNTTFLDLAFDVTVNSLRRAERDVLQDGLFKGCSSFMESNSGYPLKYKNNGKLVGETKALSTNLLYYNGYKLAVSMARVLIKDPPSDGAKSRHLTEEIIQELTKKGDDLKQLIRHKFWMEDKGYYAYVLDENDEFIPQMEGLGEALVLLSDDFEDSDERAQSILSRSHITDVGLPCLWPQFDHGDVSTAPVYERYHNGRIWPFVVGYFAVAAAKHGRMDILAKQIIQMIDLSETQNTFAEFYELDKSFPESQKRQLWSDTGFLTMIYHGLFGMTFHMDGITFAPSRPHPETFLETHNTISLLNVVYRKATIDITVHGYGNQISSFTINGVEEPKRMLKASSTGKQVIEIRMVKISGRSEDQ